MPKITKIQKLNVDSVEFSAPRQNKNNAGKTIFVRNSDDGNSLLIETPKMQVPFGISSSLQWEEKNNKNNKNGNTTGSNPPKYHLDLSFNKVDGIVFDQFQALEKELLDYAIENSEALFGEKKKEAVIEEFFTSSIKVSKPKDGNAYPARLKCKLLVNDKGEFNVGVYDGITHQQIQMTEDNYQQVIPKGSEVKVILACSGWTVEKKFGLKWRAEQILVFPRTDKLNGFAFGKDDDDSDDGVTTIGFASDSDA